MTKSGELRSRSSSGDRGGGVRYNITRSAAVAVIKLAIVINIVLIITAANPNGAMSKIIRGCLKSVDLIPPTPLKRGSKNQSPPFLRDLGGFITYDRS